jgi:hypothetical protein
MGGAVGDARDDVGINHEFCGRLGLPVLQGLYELMQLQGDGVLDYADVIHLIHLATGEANRRLELLGITSKIPEIPATLKRPILEELVP